MAAPEQSGDRPLRQSSNHARGQKRPSTVGRDAHSLLVCGDVTLAPTRINVVERHVIGSATRHAPVQPFFQFL